MDLLWPGILLLLGLIPLLIAVYITSVRDKSLKLREIKR
jgi:hypothetical protein